jgi:hypothetical protein
MLEHLRKHWRSWVLIALCFFVLCLVAAETDVFQECMNHSYYESSDHEPPKGFAVIISQLGWTQRCGGEFLIKDGEGITAFFTLVLGIATIGLWFSTRDLWKAGERQLRATRQAALASIVSAKAAKKSAAVAERSLNDLERPWIFVHLAPDLKNPPEQPSAAEGTIYPVVRMTDPSDEIPLAVFDIANHGRMPAIIEGCWIELGRAEIVGTGADIETGLVRDEFQGAIGPGEKRENLFVDCPAGREYGVVVNIITGESHPVPTVGQDEIFVFYILIRYVDVAGGRHASSFCWRFDTGVNYWVQFGGDQYNYQN